MVRTQNPNLKIIEIAAQALGPMCDELVFLGGCATALLITDSAVPQSDTAVYASRLSLRTRRPHAGTRMLTKQASGLEERF
jgi:hypothetical protein